MSNRSYWVGRGNAEKRRVDKSINDIAEAIKDAYDRASHDIDNQIAAWYQRFADDNGISLALAKKTLDAGELDDFKMTLKEYIKHGEELKSDPSWLEAMKNASTKHHIDRLTALQMTTRAEIQEALAKWMSVAIPKMDGILTESFLRYNFYMQKDMEYGKYINGADIQKLRVAANKPWTPDGIEFKKRIGINNAKLVSTMQRELMQACIIGRPYEEIAENLRNQINLSEYESVRLIRTEATHLATLAERETYGMYDVKEYEYLATLDQRTCDLCGPLDGKVFKVTDMQEGVNAPPLHPNCRCTTIPHYDDLGGSRAARDEEGNTIFVDGNTTYSEWKSMQNKEASEKEDASIGEAIKKLTEKTAAKTIIDSEGKKELTKEEYEAVDYYASGEGMYINNWLRNGKEPNDFDKEFIKNLDSALDYKVEAEKLYRSVDASAIFGEMSQTDYEWMRGMLLYEKEKGSYAEALNNKIQKEIDSVIEKEIIDKGYMSTTTDASVAYDWMDFTGSDKPIVIEFENAKGIKGRDISDIADNPEYTDESDFQHETLLARNSKYIIKKILGKEGNIVVQAKFVK